MGLKFNSIAILGKYQDPRVAEVMQALAAHLDKAGADVLASDACELELPASRVPERKLSSHAELFIAVGGDGTMLHAGRLAREAGTPILGINRGRLGFLADVTPDEMIVSVDQVLQGEYTRDERMLLEARLVRQSGRTRTEFALNDVVLQRRETGRMVDFATHVGGQYINTHAGDGLIIATPTGSTAYALSCGGPIIEPRLQAVVIVPVCPHTLTDRPIVVPASHPIEIVLLERDDTKAAVTVDGHAVGMIDPTDRVTVSRAEKSITLLHPPGHDFYGILRSKLFWGRDSRRREA